MTQKQYWPGWETVRVIGSGGFGKVYEIRKIDETGEFHSALKVISIPQSPEDYYAYVDDGYDEESITSIFKNQIEDIVSEFKMMSQFHGTSNIVSYEDHMIVPHEDGFGWDILIRMELLTSLPKYYDQKKWTEEQTIKLGVDICRALELCGQKNIIHRDIKPQNIFVNEFGDFKLGDFGVAKTMDHTTRATKTGTYNYMAPEVYKGQRYNSLADIYSLGLVMYWCLNERRLPFLPLPPVVPDATANKAALDRRMEGESLPDPLHGSPELKSVILKACAADPKDRYVSAKEMREALRCIGMNDSADDQTLGATQRENMTMTARPAPPELKRICATCGKEILKGYATCPDCVSRNEMNRVKKNHIIWIMAGSILCIALISALAIFLVIRSNNQKNELPSANNESFYEQFNEAQIMPEKTPQPTAMPAQDMPGEVYETPENTKKQLTAPEQDDFQVPVPSAPQNVASSGVDSNSVRISWQSVSNADYYEVEFFDPTYDEWIEESDYGYGTSFISTKATSETTQYRIRAGNSGGTSDWTFITYVKPVEDDPIVIINQPQDWSGNLGQYPDIRVSAIGDGLTYQWYYRNNGVLDFKKSADTDNIYDSYELTAERNGREVYCVITDQYGNSLRSDTAVMRAYVPNGHVGPVITHQPQNWTGSYGEYPNITVTASGEGLTYQWYFRDAGQENFSASSDTDNCYDSFELTTKRNGRELYCVIIDKYNCSVTTYTVTMRLK